MFKTTTCSTGTIPAMIYGSIPSGTGAQPHEKLRQVFFLGMGLDGAIFFINLMLLIAYQSTHPHEAAVRFVAPLVTVVLGVSDTLMLRNVCHRQVPQRPELLARWPVRIPGYPSWIYSLYLVLSVAMSAYLLSR